VDKVNYVKCRLKVAGSVTAGMLQSSNRVMHL